MSDDQYPFLVGLPADVVNYIHGILNSEMPWEEKIEKIEPELTDHLKKRFHEWRQNQQSFSILEYITNQETRVDVESVLQANISEKETFQLMRALLKKENNAYQQFLLETIEHILSRLTEPSRTFVQRKIEQNDLDSAEDFILDPELVCIFKLWREARGDVPKRKPPASKVFCLNIKLPSEYGSGLDFASKFKQLKRQFNTKIDKNHDGPMIIITCSGAPKEVVDSIIEVWGFIAKKMEYSEHLPGWQMEMVSKIWDKKKRISFMNKYYVDLWVGEEHGYPFVQINAFTPKEMNTAKEQLEEEYKKIAQNKTKIEQITTSLQNIQVDLARFPTECINVLILGKSGVGKSTFINSVANYLMNRSFESSKESSLKILVSFYANMIKDDTTHEVLLESTEESENDENERGAGKSGQSSTKKAKSYLLECKIGNEKRLIRLIDTPGVGDTEGLQRDKEIMNGNMAYLANFSTLHAILILMNPDEAKLNKPMEYCIKELLTRLHTSASKNILFCFPRTGNHFFKEQETRTTLKTMLAGIKERNGVDICFNNDTKFTFENSGFNTRCQLEKTDYDLPSEDMIKRAMEAWRHSAKETARLFNKINSLVPHQVDDTKCINMVRETVAALARPMSEVTRTQLSNRRTIEEKRNEIIMCQGRADQLRGKLQCTTVKLITKSLPQPQTVCTAPKCVEYKSIGGGREQPIHKTVCHTNCHLTGVQEQAVNNPALKNCVAFSTFGENRCWKDECGCDWTMHQHVRWMVETVEEMIIDREIESGLHNVEDEQVQAEEMLRALAEKDQEYQRDIDRLRQIGAEFAVFLKRNCIESYNDSFQDYLQHLISQEERKASYLGRRSALQKDLNQYLDEYKDQVNMFKSADGKHERDSQEILAMIDELKNHRHYGQFLRDAQNLEIEACRNEARNKEIKIIYDHPFSYMY